MKNTSVREKDILFFLLVVFCFCLLVLLALVKPVLLIPAAVIFGVLLLCTAFFALRLRRIISDFLRGESFEAGATRYTLETLAQPMLLVSQKTVLWSNNSFAKLLPEGAGIVLQPTAKLLPGLELNICCSDEGQLMSLNGKMWKIHASESDKSKLCFITLTDVSQMYEQAELYKITRPVYMIFEVDGYDTISDRLKESQRAHLMEQVNRLLEECIGYCKGSLTRFTASRYIAVLEERYYLEAADHKFDVLDKVRGLDEGYGITLSIGVGVGASTLEEAQEWAQQGLNMALGRGGDQAAIKSPEGFTFYGGVSRGMEKQSKVRSRIVADALQACIRKSDSVLIMGHSMSDLDSVGSALGVLHMCRVCDVPAVIVLKKKATLAEALVKLVEDSGETDCFIEPELVEDMITPDTLLVAVDNCIVNRLESPEIYRQCRHVAVIDHHRRAVGAIENAEVWYQEPYASSACELVSEMLQYVGGKDDRPTPVIAEALLSGIMLDTRNFSLHTGVRTFEAAAWLRRLGASTEHVKALFNVSPKVYSAKSKLVSEAKMYRNCAIALGEISDREASSLAMPQAANDLLTLNGVKASIVAVRQGENVAVSARSMGAVNVQLIMEEMGGGGHLTMAGAQLKGMDLQQAEGIIRRAIDTYFEKSIQEE